MANGGNVQGTGGSGQGGAGGSIAGGGIDLSWHGSGGAVACINYQGGGAGAVQDGSATDGEILASADASCDELSLWLAVTGYMGTDGWCMSPSDGGTTWGNVVLDSEGRVIGVTRFGTSVSGLVAALACMRWPCLAGQTVPYFCQIGA
jgi:hypothetical protein